MDELQIKARIINETWERLLQYGYSKLVIDELVKELGISKKTLYKYFPTKKDLVKMVLLTVVTERSDEAKRIFDLEDMEYVEKLQELMKMLGVLATQMAPLALDIQRIEPEIIAYLEEIREKFMLHNIRIFVKQGIAQGIIREDINFDIAFLTFTNVINSTLTPRALKNLPYSMSELTETIIKLFFNGILTSEYKV